MKEHEIKAVRKPEREKFAEQADYGFHNRVARAMRYEIGTIIRFRIRGEMEWREGAMKNISNSGVLIRTTHTLPLDTAIELRFALPVHLHGEFAAEVLCRGSVVRTSKSDAPGEAVLVAARIKHSRFLRQKNENEGSPKYSSFDGYRRPD